METLSPPRYTELPDPDWLEHDIYKDGRLPSEDDLRRIVLGRLAENISKAKYEEVSQDGEGVTRVVGHAVKPIDEMTNDEKQRAFRDQIEISVKTAATNAWWEDIRRTQGIYNKGDTRENSLYINRVFELRPDSKDKSDEFYQLIECGKDGEPLSRSEIGVIQETIQLVDQFTAGALSRQEWSRRIVAVTDDREDRKNDSFASSDGVVLNLPTIRKVAKQNGISAEAALAVTLGHELLGHQADRYLNDGVARGFDLSKFSDNSKPVREYGEKNTKEDLATVAESITARVADVSDEINKSPRHAFVQDEERDNEMMSILEQVFQRAQTERGQSTDSDGIYAPIELRETSGGLSYINARQVVRTEADVHEFIKNQVDEHIKNIEQGIEKSYKVKFETPGIDAFN